MRTQLLVIGPILAVIMLGWTFPASGATCNVPSGTYPTIQSAVDASSCTPIVATAGTFLETVTIDRSLELQGAGSGSSFIQGGVEVQTGTVAITGFHLSGSGLALWSHTGAEVLGFDLEVVNGLAATSIFADDFEDGTTNSWSSVTP